MANWAQTSYRIEGNSEDLQELNDLCKAFLSKERPVMEEGASEEWEGNIILALGIVDIALNCTGCPLLYKH